MKHYLELVPLFVKSHRKQSRRAVLCIVLAVFLVTGIFSMADMSLRVERLNEMGANGNYHLAITGISDDEAARIDKRPDVAAAARLGVCDYSEAAPYHIDGRTVVVGGCDASFVSDILVDGVASGHFPAADDEVMLQKKIAETLGLDVGDALTLTAPDGSTYDYHVSGLLQPMNMTENLMLLNTDAFRALYGASDSHELDASNSLLVVQLANPWMARRSIGDLQADFDLTDQQLAVNNNLLGMYGQSDHDFLQNLYLTAGILAILVMVAGVMMISASLHASVAQRTAFYGLMRCLGATPRQVMRLVRREALRWCVVALPLGVGLGIVASWLLSAVLRALTPEYLGSLPRFGVSIPGIVSGLVIGLVTVLLAARAPGKQAARVSPLVAVSGAAGDALPVRHAVKTRFFKVETALGIHHATASRKNFALMVLSFALSIALFLSFSALVDFMGRALVTLHPWSPDVSMVSSTGDIPPETVDQALAVPGVEAAAGWRMHNGVTVEADAQSFSATLFSYDDQEFAWASLNKGDLDAAAMANDTALVVHRDDQPLAVGDKVRVRVGDRTQTLTIVGELSQAVATGSQDDLALVCNEAVYQGLVGAGGYGHIDVQLSDAGGNDAVEALRALTPAGVSFQDFRQDNATNHGVYVGFALLVYSFLTIIALIAVVNVINNIAISVAVRTPQYGAFRALGLSGRQLARMVVAEAVINAACGGVVGTMLGLGGHYLLYTFSITRQWGDAWQCPLVPLACILALLLVAVVLAVWQPLRHLRKLSIVETIHEL